MNRERLPAISRYRLEGIVVDLGTGDDGELIVQEFSELTNDPALGLSSESKQDDVVSGKNCIDELRNDGFVITHNTAKKLFTTLEFLYEIGAQLVFNRDALVATLF